ncbi:uncharacterized protein KY384_007726 [Bacidia gigantensis]|uniref:uncharacterized protein n=1 Tax=Bacidia gigantensis TaxID=2732470 RepID=UPI001D04BB58|nr:uncharacterized protein KY384_007726 [Bacidia gigantensis]KAG8527573.1 hypothetical protein KY384_007726 [Bacidia gigantensis]
MVSPPSHEEVDLPLPIYRISSRTERYMLYDSKTFMWLRRKHNILGVLIGTLPQVPQQNIFLGLPVELQPEEARLLVEGGLAFVVDDLRSHTANLAARSAKDNQRLRLNLRQEGLKLAGDWEEERQLRSQQVRKKKGIAELDESVEEHELTVEDGGQREEASESLFVEQPVSNATSHPQLEPKQNRQPWSVTQSISSFSVQHLNKTASSTLPAVNPSSYALFKRLHQRGYFMTPGLRFGCQFSVYPGDPLRFHSHFLAVGAKWDEEFELLQLIGGGRLGTGVKKGFMVGGLEEQQPNEDTGKRSQEPDNAANAHVRTFCIEWVAM